MKTAYSMLKLTSFLFLMVYSSSLFGQDLQNDKPGKIKLRLDVFHQDNLINFNAGALGIYDKVTLRPGAAFSAEYAWFENKRIRLFSTAKASYHFNTYEERVASLGTELGLDIRLFKGLFLAPKGGFHRGFVQPTDVQYVYEAGEWVVADRKGEGFYRSIVTVGLDLSYRIRKGEKPLDLVLSTMGLIGAPYVPDSSLNIWVWASTGIGFRMGL